ncbi:MAG: methyltransferase domain-containing protein [Candidatus Dormibacteria bacterium]|jgi:SAM-dependent methyltransferase
MTTSLRDLARRSPAVRAVYHRGRAAQNAVLGWALRPLTFESMPPSTAVRLAYQVLLRRKVDAVGLADNVARLNNFTFTRAELAQAIRGSEEFQTIGFTGRMLGYSIHAGRCLFIRSLPPARRILDLGGTHLWNEQGAMVALGYPYPFDELTIIDLPSPERHAIYRSTDGRTAVETPLGKVTYHYHSMTDLSEYADRSVDLVYSGQSIEHVTPADGAHVLAQVFRVLKPGGHIAIDTPNARVTRLQQEALIDPDHKVEYTLPELRGLIAGAGLELVSAQGLNYAGRSLAKNRFDVDEVARNWGLYSRAEDCYILAVVARKPLEAAGTG